MFFSFAKLSIMIIKYNAKAGKIVYDINVLNFKN